LYMGNFSPKHGVFGQALTINDIKILNFLINQYKKGLGILFPAPLL
jgi:hypothetical protein